MSAAVEQNTGHRGGPRGPRPGMPATVESVERLTPEMVRLSLGGDLGTHYQPDPHADSYVKLLFLPGSDDHTGVATLSQWAMPDGRIDLDAARTALGPEHSPVMRTYSVRNWDGQRMVVDFVVHGTEGIAGPWADRATVGERILVVGPGGGYSPDPSAEHHLLAGDASALPAIAVALERLPENAQGDAVIEVTGPDEEQQLTAPVGVRIRWVSAEHGAPGASLIRAVRDLPWPAGRVQAFVHGEAGAVKELRRYLRVERGVPLSDLSISGYWRLGGDDEAWRAGKREWLRAIEESEAQAGLA